MQVRGRLSDPADRLEGRQRKLDGEPVAGVVALADLAREDHGPRQQVEQQDLAVPLEFTLPRRPCDPQPRQTILWKLLRPQRAVEAEDDETQQEQQQLRARETLRRVFRVAGRRLQELLVERADVMLGRFKALPGAGTMIGVNDESALAEVNALLQEIERRWAHQRRESRHGGGSDLQRPDMLGRRGAGFVPSHHHDLGKCRAEVDAGGPVVVHLGIEQAAVKPRRRCRRRHASGARRCRL